MHLVVLLIPNDFVTEVWEIICFARFFSSRSSAATILVKVGLQAGELGGPIDHFCFPISAVQHDALNSPSHADVTARLQAWTDERSRGGSSAAQHRTPSPEDVMQPLMGENIRGLRWSDEPFTFSSRLCSFFLCALVLPCWCLDAQPHHTPDPSSISHTRKARIVR